MSTSRVNESSSNDGSVVAQGVIVVTKEVIHERRVDHALWLLNHLHVPLTLSDMEGSLYDIIDVVANIGGPNGPGAGGANNGGGSSRHLHSLSSSHHRNSSHRIDRQSSSIFSPSLNDMSALAENLDRKYKLTESTLFWTINHEYNVVFVIDISQSMYSLDPNTNETYIHTALETLEKCLMGMVQPFTVRSTLGLPDYLVEPHICASVVGYCPRPPGSYPAERDRKKLPFCRTLTHAHMVTVEDMPEFMKSIRNFLFNYECEIQDSLGSFPPPPPPIPLDPDVDFERQQDELFEQYQKQESRRSSKNMRYGHSQTATSEASATFESASKSNKQPKAGDTFTFTYCPDAPLLHTLQIADYFLKIMPEICSPAFVFLTDGVMRSNFATSRAQVLTRSLCRRSTQCTFIQVGSCGGFTPETTLGYVGDNELLLCMAACLDGRFIYASDCPDTVFPQQINFYHQSMLIRETRLVRTHVRHRYDVIQQGGRRLGDMPRERLNPTNSSNLESTPGSDVGFPWCPDCKPPIVHTVTARYSDYNIPVSMNVLIEARMNEGFVVRNIQISKHERDGIGERIVVRMELVWHANITIVYRLTNIHYMSPNVAREEPGHRNSNSSGSSRSNSLNARSRSDSVSSDDFSLAVDDRGQRSPNSVDIVIRSYNMFTLAFLQQNPGDGRRSELFTKAAMLHQFLKTMVEKDERLRQIYYPALVIAPGPRAKAHPRVFIPPVIDTSSNPPHAIREVPPLATRISADEVDPMVFLDHSEWSEQHSQLYEMMMQFSKNGSTVKMLASFRHTASMFIDSELIMSYVEGINFAETAKHGQRIMADFRAHVCQAGTWALMKDENKSVVFLRDKFRLSHRIPVFIVAHWEMATNWILRVTFSLFNGTMAARNVVVNCLPSFGDSFKPSYRDPSRESVARATRPLHLLPVDLDITDIMAPNLLSTRDMGDLHTYVVEWRWTYLAREGTRKDLSGEGSDRDIVRQALHRLAMTLGYHRLSQDFTLVNAKGESTGLMGGTDASMYDSCITFYHEREGYDGEELLLGCQYQIIVDMKQSSVTARTWIEPWSPRFIRSLFEDDFRILAPLGTFQQILQPERCFQLKVPNIAEFHSKRMNMFSIMAVVNSSRIALRMLQLPEVSPAYAAWNQPDGADSIKLDDPTFRITPDPNPDDDIEIQELDDAGNVMRRTKATEYYKTHDREETRRLAMEKKLKIVHVGSSHGERQAIILERFMLTLFEKSEEGKYDPYIERYRLNEYNPFILALINPGHPRKLFFNKLAVKWMTTGEFTMVAYRCFLEFALFKHCDAIAVNAERFHKLRFAGSIISELAAHSPGMHQATGVPNALDEHLFVDKWFVIRLPNNTSFLMVIMPNVPLAAPRRDQSGQAERPEKGDQAETVQDADSSSAPTHKRSDSQPASPPVFTPALESSITGSDAGIGGGLTALNAYTLVMECSMDSSEMRRHVGTMDVQRMVATKRQLNLRPLDVGSSNTRVPGDAFQGFVGQRDVPIPFTEYAVAEIQKLERMYTEAQLQTMYLALLLKRQVSAADLAFSQRSSLWRRRSIDMDITAFLHSQDAARLGREPAWDGRDCQSIHDQFAKLIGESFTALPGNTADGKLYYCHSTPERESELEMCLQLAQNPLFINLQCSLEVLDSTVGHKLSLNMPIEQLPLSLEKLCEQAGLPWRPPTDHFDTSMDVRVIMHINCLYLPEEPVSKGKATSRAEEPKSKVPQQNSSKQEVGSQITHVFQKTMSLSSLARSEKSKLLKDLLPTTESGGDGDGQLPSAAIAKQCTNMQIATLDGLPQDQLQLLQHCHRKMLRFIAQETLYALRDIHPVTSPLLSQVWHTIESTVDDDICSDRFEFAHNKLEMKFLTTSFDIARRRHAMDLVMTELLKMDGTSFGFPFGKLQKLNGIVYMRDVRSRSARNEARARIEASTSNNMQGISTAGVETGPIDLEDALPSWFLIKPTESLDGVLILTHNYSSVTEEAADNVLAATRQLLMVALKAANTRLLLEEIAETHRFPDQLVLPDAARANSTSVSSTRLGQYNHPDTQAIRDELSAGLSSSPSAPVLSSGDKQRKASHLQNVHINTLASGSSSSVGPPTDNGSGGLSIASVLTRYTPESPTYYMCQEQFKKTFALHPRISPQKAIQSVLASSMMNNRLSNQRNMFFVRDGSSLFFGLLTIGRIPYICPFVASDKIATAAGQDSLVSAAPSPMLTSSGLMSGAHTMATTSPNPLLQSTSANAHCHSPMMSPIHSISMFAAPGMEGSGRLGTTTLDLHPPQSPRVSLSHTESSLRAAHNNGSRHSMTEGSMRRGTIISATPESPSGSYLASSLTNLESAQSQPPHALTGTGTAMPVFELHAPAGSKPAALVEESVPCIILHIYGVDKPSKELTQGLVQQIGECIVVNVTMPEMSDMLFRQVSLNNHDMNFLFPKCSPEPTILYLPLPRFVHDLDRLIMHFKQTMGVTIPQFPTSRLVTRSLRRSFKHLRKHAFDHGEDEEDTKGSSVTIGTRVPDTLRKDLARILEGWEYDHQTPRRVPVERLVFLYNFIARTNGIPPPGDMAQIGNGIAIVSALPLNADRVVAKAMWGSAAQHEPSNTSNTPASTLGAGAGHRFEAPVSGIAADSLGLRAAAAASRADGQYSRHRRVASCFNPEVSPIAQSHSAAIDVGHRHLTLEQRANYLLHRRVSHTPSPNERGANPSIPSSPSASTPSSSTPLTSESLEHSEPAAVNSRSLPVSQLAGLFGEYLSQFKAAHSHMRLELSKFDNLSDIMERQVAEFAGEPVMAITLWSNASIRVERLALFVSRAYWNALGDYVSEQVLYPILSAGWGHRLNYKIGLPDPYVDMELCSVYPGEPDSSRSCPAYVEVELGTEWGDDLSAEQTHQSLLRAHNVYLPSAPSTFTESTKKQVHAMEIARQMAQYWGGQDTVKSLRHLRQRLPRVTGISHYFSEELRGVLETMCPAMNPALFRLLENPLVLSNSDESFRQEVPKPLFPAHSLRKQSARTHSKVVYDVSALPKALRDTRQSFCIMCTLPLETAKVAQAGAQQLQVPAYQGQVPMAGGTGPVGMAHNRRFESLKKYSVVADSVHGMYNPRHSSRTSLSSGPSHNPQGPVHGLGLQVWGPGEQQQKFGPHGSRRGNDSGSGNVGSGGAMGDAHYPKRRSHRMPIIAERFESSPKPKKMPPSSDYQPIADPDTPVLSADQIPHYSPQSMVAGASTKAWLTVWLVGGELEMVGYNVSQHLWDCVCDQIHQRLEREKRRKQLLGMFAAHMCGVFPGYEQQPRHKGMSSTWLDRDVTRDLINKFALLKQLTCDDQIHYFNIERLLSSNYMRMLGVEDGSAELRNLIMNPPVAEMTLNDTKTELILSQLQAEHLRWARKLTFVDYTQPYVDTSHPDTLFRIGSRYMRAYQGRIGQVLRYDELMKIAERWRRLIASGNFHDSMNHSARMVVLDLQTDSTNASSLRDNRLLSRQTSSQAADARSDIAVQAPPRGDTRETLARSSSDFTSKAAGKIPANAVSASVESAKAPPEAQDQTHTQAEDESDVSLDEIKMIMENARLLHFVCAPLPITKAIKPAGTDLRAFQRLFRVISALLQNLADSYIDYLCSTGYVVARRFEKMLPWKEALFSLEYSPEKIVEFTQTVLGHSHIFFGGQPNQFSEAEAALPGISVPSAYLFGSTERTHLVTDIEVSPKMLSIHMHALSRFTPEWRSAVPGYMRSSVNPNSIKKFTFDLSRYKKLLHAKSFVYDFQLRYVASILKPLEKLAPESSDPQSLNLPETRHHDCRDHIIYSSDSGLDDDSGSSSDGDSAESADDGYENAWVSSDQVGGTSNYAGSHYRQPHCHRRNCDQRTVAQSLHVHVDLTVFLAELSEQRYFSTRFSSRRLVRASFPIKYRDMYEYFLNHAERYHFYTEGCRPPMGDMPSTSTSPSGDRSVPIADLCTKLASHSGCYRLYEGVLPGLMSSQYGSDFGSSDMHSQAGSYRWGPNGSDPLPLHKSEILGTASRPIGSRGEGKHTLRTTNVASSAPETTMRGSLQMGDSSFESAHKLRVYPLAFNNRGRGANMYAAADGGSFQHAQPSGGGREMQMHSRERRPIAMSYAAGSQWADRFKPSSSHGRKPYFGSSSSSSNNQHLPHMNSPSLAVLSNPEHAMGVNSAQDAALSGPRIANSIASRVGRASRYDHHQHENENEHEHKHPASSIMTDAMSSADKSRNFALKEYTANKIHLASNKSSVRVSLMAITPDCDSCRSETIQEARRSCERQRSHAKQRLQRKLKQQQHSADGDADICAEGDDEQGSLRARKHHKSHGHKKRNKPPLRTLDDIEELFGSPKHKPQQPITGLDSRSPLYRASAANDVGDSLDSGGSHQYQRQHRHRHRHRHSHSHSDDHQSHIPFKMAEHSSSGSRNQSPLQQWMSSLANRAITDPQTDGLRTSINGDSAGSSALPVNGACCNETAQLSYYLVIDMDPHTTTSLNNLKADDVRSRNGSLGPLPSSVGPTPDGNDVEDYYTLGIRPCKGCQMLSRCAGRPKVCGIHKVLGAVQIDMRDWENKGSVWGSDPTMVMEVSAIDPDEYDKEDPNVLAWIQTTAHRLIRHTALDYHRDLNWYRVYEHMRVADLPTGLAPADICELIGFVERQEWVDVGTTDDAAQQLIGLGVSGRRVIEALQLRMRKLYSEPAQTLASLLADQGNAAPQPMATPHVANDDCGKWTEGTAHRLETAATSSTAQPSTPSLCFNVLPYAKQSEICAEAPAVPEATVQPGFVHYALAGDRDADVTGGNMFGNHSAAPAGNRETPNMQGPVAVIDGHGRVLTQSSSANIGDLLRLLSPLNTRLNKKILLDPAFQKMLSRYIRLDITTSAWLCNKHRHTHSLHEYNWSLDDASVPNMSGALGGKLGANAVPLQALLVPSRFPAEDGMTRSTNRRLHQVQEIDIGTPCSSIQRQRRQRRRTGNSAASLGINDSLANSIQMSHGLSSAAVAAADSASVAGATSRSSNGHKVLDSYHHGAASPISAQLGSNDNSPMGTVNGTTGAAYTTALADKFTRACVEILPGTLLVIDPEDVQFAARMFVLNPFAYHGMLELMFVCSVESGEVELSQIRAVVRDRRRDGLYEYERKHINLVLSTVSAVVWDVMTEDEAAHD
ncbi:hypothetical protein BX661DRAFT_168093 [Kickxella alabastrina]|uniref:uncharacterized protein n=1 Tax=Kickxella alabastrina TaxID=61397 RepID=UPI002220DB9B|nr:uncharacterized protein BX661DRAFT_168093 [Kickxella alabastrina]KAI7834901.1 hypothetical protein BX661DRAFT_168093 [Kickxella alabastrina]